MLSIYVCSLNMLSLNFWKIKKSRTVLNGLIETVHESNRKPSKLWVDQGKQFYNNPMHKWLEDNDIVMYSTHNEG